jgi:hypothetical protein
MSTRKLPTLLVERDDAPCLFAAAVDLADHTLLLCLWGFEETVIPGETPTQTPIEVIRTGMVLAGEAWRRGLISAKDAAGALARELDPDDDE